MKQLLNEISYAAIDTRAETLHYSALDTQHRDMQIVSVGGILRDPVRQWSGSHSDSFLPRCTVADIVDSSGEWTAIAERRQGVDSKYLIFGDYAGYAPIFYAHIPGKALVVSDSFHGVVQGFTRLGGRVTLNMGNYLALITGKARAFETLIGIGTMANEISLLRPSEVLYVDANQVYIAPREPLSQVSTTDSYQSVLSSAVEYTSGLINKFVSDNSHLTPLITLSGGVDSRLVLAFLSTTSHLKDFEVWTMDPRIRKSATQRNIYIRDAEISNEIRKAYKLQWMSPRTMKKFSWSFSESLARHQSYNSNFSFKYNPTKYLLYDEMPILTLRGGGGEILRGTSGALNASQTYSRYLEQGGTSVPIDWATDNLLERSRLRDGLRAPVWDYLREQLRNQDRTSVRGIFDSYYREHRNRGHFGHHRVSAGRNDQMLQVLSNPHIQRLVDISDYEYIGASGVVADLFDATEPKLRKFPFESTAAHRDLYVQPYRFFRKKNLPYTYRDRDSWITDFDDLMERTPPHEYSFLGAPGIRGEVVGTQAGKFGAGLLARGFSIIEELSPEHIRTELAVQHKEILADVENKQLQLGRLVAVVASATDIVRPMHCDVVRHYFTDRSTPSRIQPCNLLQRASSVYEEVLDSGN